LVWAKGENETAGSDMGEALGRCVVDNSLVLRGVAFEKEEAVCLEVVWCRFEDFFDELQAVLFGIEGEGGLVVKGFLVEPRPVFVYIRGVGNDEVISAREVGE